MAWSNYQIEDKIAIAVSVLAMGAVFGKVASLLTGVTPLLAGAFGIGMASMAVPAAYALLDVLAKKMVASERHDRQTYDPVKTQAAIEQIVSKTEPEAEVEYESDRYRELVASQHEQGSRYRLH
jgi:hypothetical protein